MRQKLIQSAQNACLLKEYQVKKAMINPEDLWNLIWKYKRILIVITYLLRILRIEILKRSWKIVVDNKFTIETDDENVWLDLKLTTNTKSIMQ